MTNFYDIVERSHKYNAANRKFLADKARAERLERERARSRQRVTEQRAARLAKAAASAGIEAPKNGQA